VEFALRNPISALEGNHFDVVIVGGGISGASAVQHLAAAGYSVLLVEKGDFCSGATSRSGRILHCGLRYMAPEKSPWEFLLNPKRLFTVIDAGRRSILCRSEFLTETPERLRPLRLAFPLYRGDPYKPWHVDLGARFLQALDPKRIPLEYRRMSPAEALSMPLLKWLRDPEKLTSVATFLDYQFHWPDRLAMDAILDAERMGAIARNYTKAVEFLREDQGWRFKIEDGATGETAWVSSSQFLNLTGVWIDGVNQRAAPDSTPPRKIVGVKGTHMAVRLPPECKGMSVAGINREGEQIFCMAWGDHHYIGPTETMFDGDLDRVYPLEEEIAFLLAEINHFLPGIDLNRKSVEFAWAGVRPITFDPNREKVRRIPFSVVQDMHSEGMRDAATITWSVIMFHRQAGRQIVKLIKKRRKPSGEPKPISYAARLFPDNQNSPPIVDGNTAITAATLRHIAETEQPRHLVDILYRRSGLGWEGPLPPEAVRRAAEAVAEPMGWDAALMEKEISAFGAYQEEQHMR
jgi:glycerol-3-phosphate dehydrogenase